MSDTPTYEQLTHAVKKLSEELERCKIREKTLEEAKSYYRAFFEYGPDGVVILDPQTATLIDFNDQVCRQLGYSRAEFAQLRLSDIEVNETPEVAKNHIQNILQKGFDDFETRHRTKYGEIKYVHVSAQVINIGFRQFYHCIWRDITERKNNEDRHHSIIQTALDGFWLTDIHGQLLEVNESYCRMSGYCEDELLSMNIANLEAIEYPQDVHRHMQEVIDKGAIRFETRHQRKGGSIYEVEISVQFRNEKGGRCVCFIRDISERKLAEQKLRESEQNFRSLSESSPDYIMRYDRDCRHTYMNPAALAAYGLSEGDTIGKTHLESGFPEDLSKIGEEKIIQVFETGKPSHTEFPWKSANRQVYLDWRLTPEFDAQNQVVSVLGVSRDITERKQAEEQLRELEERFRRTFYTSPDSVNINQMDGTYVEINKGFTQLTGYTRKDVIGKTSADINIWDIPEDRERLVEGLQRDKYVRNLESRFLVKDGSYKTALMSAAIIKLKGEPHILSITRDITDFRKTERDKLILERQLQQAQKMEAIGTLAGGIAHDFNNILAAILGYAEMVREDSPAGSVAARDLDQVLIAGDRAKNLVKQILAFSRQNEAEKIPLQLAAIVQEAIKLLRASIPTTIAIEQDLDRGCDLVLADPTEIHQIIMNLGTNAFHAMEEHGGTLAISLKGKTLSPQDLAHEPHLLPGKYINLTVRDTGSGMKPEIKEKIFDPYFTTKDIGKGTGMGLAIIHGIVKSYGGFITCESKIGEGSVFHIYLPSFEEHIIPQKDSMKVIPIGNERVLFVDDEQMLAEMGQVLLERLGYTVTVRMSSLEALTTFKNQPDAFNLVITDQTMPGMTGMDLARRMLQIRPDLPIILCTGYSSLISEEKVKSAGIKGFALKPLTKRDIATLIRKVLEKS